MLAVGESVLSKVRCLAQMSSGSSDFSSTCASLAQWQTLREGISLMRNVFLVRHGLSQSNSGLPTSSPEIASLTQPGQDQAQCVADFFRDSEILIDRIITSSYLRARETAMYTREIFPDAFFEEWKVQEFTYLSSLHKKLSTLEDRRPLVDAYWQALDPCKRNAEGSESFRDFVGRARNFLVRLQDLESRHIAVFSHEQFISAVLWLIERQPQEISSRAMQGFRTYFKRYPIANGEIIHLYQETGKPWRFRRIVHHLRPASFQFWGLAASVGD